MAKKQWKIKFTDAQKNAICKKFNDMYPASTLADEYNVSRNTIVRVLHECKDQLTRKPPAGRRAGYKGARKSKPRVGKTAGTSSAWKTSETNIAIEQPEESLAVKVTRLETQMECAGELLAMAAKLLHQG